MSVYSKINIPVISSLLGMLLIINGVFMFLCIPVAYLYSDGSQMALFISAAISILAGLIAYYRFPESSQNSRELRKREGCLIVTLGWVSMSISGALPYYIGGYVPTFTDAFFETMSGYTTTGASILTDIEILPEGILLWRSLTHWIGGMGIIVLTIAVLPLLGIGGMQLFVAEAPGLSPDKISPRIQDTAKRLWLVYLLLTLANIFFLYLAGMNLFESVNHAFATMATGGFSTRNLSMAAFGKGIQYVTIVFMFLAGTNFTLNYFGIKLKFKAIWKNEEFRFYLALVALFTFVSTSVLFIRSNFDFNLLEQHFRDSCFQVLSIITTTGFVSADFTLWGPFLTMLFFALMFIGGSAGSTAGGIKAIRHLLLMKNTYAEFKRQLHPNAVVAARLNHRAVEPEIIHNISAFVIAYLSITVISFLLISAMGVDFESSLGAVSSSIGNVGPGLGKVCPTCNYAGMPSLAKWLLSFLMLLGRLELFTVLIILTPSFWRRV